MDSKSIKYKFKKLSPMNVKKLNKSIDNYFIKITDSWFNLVDIYGSINELNPNTNVPFTLLEKKKIIKSYKELIEVEPSFTDNANANVTAIEIQNEKLLTDYIELFESQINELYSKQEEIYALTQTHQHEIEKINYKL
jgi:hypothetical protein